MTQIMFPHPVQASEWSGPVATVGNGCDAVMAVITGILVGCVVTVILGGYLSWATVSPIISMCMHLPCF